VADLQRLVGAKARCEGSGQSDLLTGSEGALSDIYRGKFGFPRRERHFLQMNSLAGNAARPVTFVPPALGEVYQVFESGTGATDESIRDK